MQNKTKIIQNIQWQPVFRTIKWIVPFFIALVLYKKFYKNTSFSFLHFKSQLQQMDGLWYLLLIGFSALNWSIETWKWQFLVRKLEPISFKKALKSVLSGVAVSQLLPYRTGEYLGRLAYISDRNKLSAGFLSVAGSFAQLLATLTFGVLAFTYLKPIPYPSYALGLFIALFVLLCVGYFYLPQFRRFKRFVFFEVLRSAFMRLKTKDLFIIFALSVLRYATFVIPYALMAHHFNLPVSSSLYAGITAVACIYFLQTISPNFILTDIVIRMSVPALVFSGQMEAVSGMEYIPGMFIYLFNIAIPMCLGAVILLLVKLKKQ